MKQYYIENPQTIKTIEKRKNALIGLKRNEETKKKMSKSQRYFFDNNTVSKETKLKQSVSAKNRKKNILGKTNQEQLLYVHIVIKVVLNLLCLVGILIIVNI